MTDLRFDLIDWLSSSYGDEEVRATTGSLRISTGDGVPITEVEDTIARTVRSHVNVPLVSVAQWLLINWWRLRWEGKPAGERFTSSVMNRRSIQLAQPRDTQRGPGRAARQAPTEVDGLQPHWPQTGHHPRANALCTIEPSARVSL